MNQLTQKYVLRTCCVPERFTIVSSKDSHTVLHFSGYGKADTNRKILSVNITRKLWQSSRRPLQHSVQCLQSHQDYSEVPEGFLEEKALGLTPGMSRGLTTLRMRVWEQTQFQREQPVGGGSAACLTDKEEAQGAGVQPGRERWVMSLKTEPFPGQAWLCKPGRRLSALSLWELGCHWRVSVWSAKVISVFQEGCSGGCIISDQVTFSR